MTRMAATAPMSDPAATPMRSRVRREVRSMRKSEVGGQGELEDAVEDKAVIDAPAPIGPHEISEQFRPQSESEVPDDGLPVVVDGDAHDGVLLVVALNVLRDDEVRTSKG